MKLLCAVMCLFVISSSLFSQEFIKDSKVTFKDKSIIKGDFYYYPSIPNLVQVVDSTGKKTEYKVWDIDFIEGKNILVKNINYQGTDKLFESVVEGEKLSLYKTNESDKLMLYVLKDNQLSWLECGKKEFEMNGKMFSKEIVTYKGILKFVMNDNADLVRKVDNINCTEKEVTELVVAYNEGHIAYFKNKETAKADRIPHWKIYSSYSSFSGDAKFIPYDVHKSLVGASDLIFNTSSGSFGQIGAEYFPFEGSKHSFRFGLEYGKFYNKKTDNPKNDWTIDQFNKAIYKYFDFNVSYYYDFLRMPKANMYLGIRLLDLGNVAGPTSSQVVIAPRLSPGFGVEYHLTRKIDVFGELNHLLKMKNFPNNYTFGLSYDLK